MALLSAPLNELLGTRSRLAAIRVLARATDSLSGREVARRAALTPRGALEALRQLAAAGVIDERVTSSQSLFALRRDTLVYKSLVASLVEAEQAWTATLLHALREHVRRVATRAGGKPRWAGLFGSVARGDDDARSDIDIAMIAGDDAHASALRSAHADMAGEITESIGRRVSVIVLAPAQLRKLAKLNDPLVTALRTESRRLIGDRSLDALIDDAT